MQAAWNASAKMSPNQVVAALSNLLPNPGGSFPLATVEQARLAYMYATVIKELSNTEAMGQMVNEANHKTGWLWLMRMVGSSVLPFSVSSGLPYQGLHNQYQAELKKHPNNWIAGEGRSFGDFPVGARDHRSHSFSPSGVPFPTTLPALQWADQNKFMADNYPAAAAALVPTADRTAPYSQFAANSLVLIGLRRKDTPNQFLDHIMFQMGDNFLYNVIYPAYNAATKAVTGSATGYDYATYQRFFSTSTSHPGFVKLFGEYYDPVWYHGIPNQMNGYADSQTRGTRLQAISEFGVMAGLPEYSGSSVQDQAIYVAAQLGAFVPKIGPAEASTSVGYQATVTRWNAILDQVQKGTYNYPSAWQITDPRGVGSALSYAIETIFRPFASQYADTGQAVNG